MSGRLALTVGCGSFGEQVSLCWSGLLNPDLVCLVGGHVLVDSFVLFGCAPRIGGMVHANKTYQSCMCCLSTSSGLCMLALMINVELVRDCEQQLTRVEPLSNWVQR